MHKQSLRRGGRFCYSSVSGAQKSSPEGGGPADKGVQDLPLPGQLLRPQGGGRAEAVMPRGEGGGQRGGGPVISAGLRQQLPDRAALLPGLRDGQKPRPLPEPGAEPGCQAQIAGRVFRVGPAPQKGLPGPAVGLGRKLRQGGRGHGRQLLPVKGRFPDPAHGLHRHIARIDVSELLFKHGAADEARLRPGGIGHGEQQGHADALPPGLGQGAQGVGVGAGIAIARRRVQRQPGSRVMVEITRPSCSATRDRAPKPSASRR